MPTKKPSKKRQTKRRTSPTPCSVVMTRYECNLLLYALDDFYGTDNEGCVRDTRGIEPLAMLQYLRDKLFAAHDHEPNAESEDLT